MKLDNCQTNREWGSSSYDESIRHDRLTDLLKNCEDLVLVPILVKTFYHLRMEDFLLSLLIVTGNSV